MAAGMLKYLHMAASGVHMHMFWMRVHLVLFHVQQGVLSTFELGTHTLRAPAPSSGPTNTNSGL